MSSLSSAGLALSVVFTCLLLALIAEIYYLLWWKKRIIRRDFEDNYRNSSREFFYLLCCKTQVTSTANISTNPQIHQSPTDQEFHFHHHDHNKDCCLHKPFDSSNGRVIGAEFMTGPPRFLFTINEETKEDMDQCEDGRSTRDGGKRKCLKDLMKNSNNSSYATPHSSPPYLTPPLTPIMSSCHSSNGGCYNPFDESSTDAEFNRIVKSSPPPKFKFLRDAEEKLQRKTNLTQNARVDSNLCKNEGGDGSFMTIIVATNNEINVDKPNHHYHSPLCHSSCS